MQDLDDMVSYLEERFGKPAEVRAVEVFRELIPHVSEGKDILEIGAGRSPMLDEGEYEKTASYTINDISEHELALAPDKFDKIVCDFSSDIPKSEQNKYDLIFSSMVLEHVRSGSRFFDNTYVALKPGGIAIHLHPTLYSLPMVVNYLFPERLTKAVLIAFRPHRTDDNTPKFPSRYSYCYSTKSQENRLKAKGFSKVAIMPFWRHTYYEKIPPLEAIRKKVEKVAGNRDWRFLTANAITMVQK